MNLELILNALARHVSLSLEEQEIFCSHLQFRMVRKRQFLLNAGEVCEYGTFVTTGCLRGFIIDKHGLEHVLSFAPSGWWIADMASLITKSPGHLNIEAVEDTETLLLSKKDLESLYLRIPKMERFFRIITENSLVAHQGRLIDIFSLTAEERYLKFCRMYPTLVSVLPQKHIAAYLGVTPEFFSRMRTNLLRNK